MCRSAYWNVILSIITMKKYLHTKNTQAFLLILHHLLNFHILLSLTSTNYVPVNWDHVTSKYSLTSFSIFLSAHRFQIFLCNLISDLWNTRVTLIIRFMIIQYIPRFMQFKKEKKNPNNQSLVLFNTFVGKLYYLGISGFPA